MEEQSIRKKRDIAPKIDENILNQTKESLEKDIPPGYVGITFPTDGRLAIPKKLHFRDYTFADIAKLSASKDKQKTIIQILNRLVLEDIDCGDMHPQELIFVRVMLIRAFYGNTLRNVRVFIDEDLPYDERNHEDNITETEVLISSLNLRSLPKEVKKNSLNIELNDKKYSFRFLKVKDLLLVNSYIDEKYKEEDRKFSKLKITVETYPNDIDKLLELISPDEYYAFQDYYEAREGERLELLRACQLISVDEEVFTDDQIKEKAEQDLPFSLWEEVTKIFDSIEFGYDTTADVEIYADGKNYGVKSRRFSFRESNLIPTANVSSDSKGLSYSFG